MNTLYKIRYAYGNPSNAGPFRGSATIPMKYEKGDLYWGPFGAATITSCRCIKERTDLRI
jgi:hypothetical protein